MFAELLFALPTRFPDISGCFRINVKKPCSNYDCRAFFAFPTRFPDLSGCFRINVKKPCNNYVCRAFFALPTRFELVFSLWKSGVLTPRRWELFHINNKDTNFTILFQERNKFHFLKLCTRQYWPYLLIDFKSFHIEFLIT